MSLFPIYYLLFIYGFVYIFPTEKFDWNRWFDWLRSEDGPLEWLQFLEYVFSSLLAFLIFIRRKKKRKLTSWLLIAFLSLLIAGEEISWGERLTGIGITSISNLNVQEKQIFIIYLFFIITYWIQF